MRVETKRMLLGRSFLAAWLIACFSIAAGQTYPSLKKALTCGTFISLLDGSLKSQMVSFAIPVAAVLPWSDSFLQEYKRKSLFCYDIWIFSLDICYKHHTSC